MYFINLIFIGFNLLFGAQCQNDYFSILKTCAPMYDVSSSNCNNKIVNLTNYECTTATFNITKSISLDDCFEIVNRSTNIYATVYVEVLHECLTQYSPVSVKSRCYGKSGVTTFMRGCCLDKDIERISKDYTEMCTPVIYPNRYCPSVEHKIKLVKYFNYKVTAPVAVKTIINVDDNSCFIYCWFLQGNCDSIEFTHGASTCKLFKDVESYAASSNHFVSKMLCCKPLRLLPKSVMNFEDIPQQACFNGSKSFYDGSERLPDCVPWISVKPKEFQEISEKYLKNSNDYCRNFNGDSLGPWCYVFENVYKYCQNTKCASVSLPTSTASSDEFCSPVDNSVTYRALGWCENNKELKLFKIQKTLCEGVTVEKPYDLMACQTNFLNQQEMNLMQISLPNNKCEYLLTSDFCYPHASTTVIKKSCCKKKPIDYFERNDFQISSCYSYGVESMNRYFGSVGYHDAMYLSKKSVTINGLECIDWTENFYSFLEDKIKHNFCRNFDLDPEGPWCLVNAEGEIGYCENTCGLCKPIENKNKFCPSDQRLTFIEMPNSGSDMHLIDYSNTLNLRKCIKTCFFQRDCFKATFHGNICSLFSQTPTTNTNANKRTFSNNETLFVASCCIIDESVAIPNNYDKRDKPAYRWFMWNYFFVLCGLLLLIVTGFSIYIFLNRRTSIIHFHEDEQCIDEGMKARKFTEIQNVTNFCLDNSL